MRPITETLLFDDALELVMNEATPIARTEAVPLIAADGRVAARDVTAAVDVPPFDRAAMDGYAVVAGDTFGAGTHAPRTLTCVGTLFTGQAPSRGLVSGECIEIATGAPMPPGADAVVMVEETERERDGTTIRVLTPVYPRQHVGRRGADITAGQTVIAREQVLNPSRIGALAATGVTTVEVYARPSVAILSTGNEIVEPGQPLQPGQIYDINRFTLETIIGRHGATAAPLPIAADTIDDLSAALQSARRHDVVVFSGGSSVGERDLILDALRREGDVLFHGVAVKPGKPTVFGRISTTPFDSAQGRPLDSAQGRPLDSAQGRPFDSAQGRPTPVFGMPGYPTSCLSNAYMMLVPFLRKMARLPRWEPRTIDVPLARRVVSTTGRHQFYTVRIVDGLAEPAFKASGDITSMANADGYIEIPAQTDVVEAGTLVTVKLF